MKLTIQQLYRRFKRSIKRKLITRGIIKPGLITPESMLKVVRLKYPNSMAGKIESSWKDSTLTPAPKVIERVKFDRMKIYGGPYHGFLEGFSIAPFTLVIETGTREVYKTKPGATPLSIEYTSAKTVARNFPRKRITLSSRKRIEWEKRAAEYNAQHSEVVIYKAKRENKK